MAGGILAGQVVIVTGAAQGIGKATARALAQAGARVVGMDIEAELLARAAAEGPEFRPFAGDVTSPEAVDAAVAQALGAFGRIESRRSFHPGAARPSFASLASSGPW